MNDLVGTWRLVATRAWDDDENVLPAAGEACVITKRGIVLWSSSELFACTPATASRTGERGLNSIEE